MSRDTYALRSRWKRGAKQCSPAAPVVLVAPEEEQQVILDLPNDVRAADRMAEFVSQEVKNTERDNTTVAYDGKQQEFKEFCRAVYPNEEFNTVITHEKIYRFFFYLCFREQKKRGGKRRKNAPPPAKFILEDYQKVMNFFFTEPEDGNPNFAFPRPKKPVSKATFLQYKAIIKGLHTEQQDRGVNTNAWEFVWTSRCKKLEKHCKERLPALRKANCEEKHTGNFTPYQIVSKYGDLENEYWMAADKAPNKKTCLSTRLRHRACILYLTSGVLRSESLYKADVSDFFFLRPPKKKGDVHEKVILINQIPEGKTTHGKFQYGRATRHRDVRLCAVGALAFYMMHRISVTGEFANMSVSDWLDNKKWFLIKYLKHVDTHDNTKELTSDTFGTSTKEYLVKHRLPTNKVFHLGRGLGTKLLNCDEVHDSEVKNMGSWNQTVYDESYSSKLPMKAIRSLAGYQEGEVYFNTRTTVVPSEELRRMTPIGLWSIDMAPLVEANDEAGVKLTATYVLDFFNELTKIFLQDAAATFLLHPERKDGMFYRAFPLFETEEFQDFMETMKLALAAEQSPQDATLAHVLPGVHERFLAQEASIATLTDAVAKGMQTLQQDVRGGFQAQSEFLQQQSSQLVGTAFVEAGQHLMNSSPSSSPNNDSSNSGDDEEEEGKEDESDPVVAVPPPLPDPRNLFGQEQATSTVFLPKMKHKHGSLCEVWEEWFGIGSRYNADGGIAGCNEKYGKGWRKDACIDPTQYSRHSRIIAAIEKEAELTNMQPLLIIAEWEAMYTDCNRSVGAMVRRLQDEGKIPKKKSRGNTWKQ